HPRALPSSPTRRSSDLVSHPPQAGTELAPRTLRGTGTGPAFAVVEEACDGAHATVVERGGGEADLPEAGFLGVYPQQARTAGGGAGGATQVLDDGRGVGPAPEAHRRAPAFPRLQPQDDPAAQRR